MKFFKALMLIISMICVSACNDGGQSASEKEDAEFEQTYNDAVKFALSDANRIANAQAKASAGGGSGGYSNTFLWKPVAENGGNLVVLIPASMYYVNSCTISGSFGRESSGVDTRANGRPGFRFSRPGGSYGNNITVYAGGRSWHIANGGSRTEF